MPVITKEVEVEIDDEDYCQDLDDEELMDLIEHAASNLSCGEGRFFKQLLKGLDDNTLETVIGIARENMTEKGQISNISNTFESVAYSKDQDWILQLIKEMAECHLEEQHMTGLFEWCMEEVEGMRKQQQAVETISNATLQPEVVYAEQD